MVGFLLLSKGRGEYMYSSPSGIPSIHPLHVIINHEKERSNIDNNTGTRNAPMARNEFFQIKDNLGSFNFKNHKKIHPPPQFTSPRPRHATHEARERYFSFCTKNPPLKKEREGTEGERGKKKRSGNSKSPQYSPGTPRERVRKKISARKSFAISTVL